MDRDQGIPQSWEMSLIMLLGVTRVNPPSFAFYCFHRNGKELGMSKRNMDRILGRKDSWSYKFSTWKQLINVFWYELYNLLQEFPQELSL